MTDNPEMDGVSFWSGETEYLASAYQYDPAFRERFSLWRTLLAKYGRSGMSALDMGCGTGIFSFYLAEQGVQVLGIDGSREMVDYCRAEKERRNLPLARFRQATLPDAALQELPPADLIVCSSVLEYIPAFDETLALFVNLLKDQGVLIFSLPNKFSIARTYYRLKYRLRGQPAVYAHIKHFASPGSLTARLRPDGLQLLETAYYAHENRVARLCRQVYLPALFTEDLFVSVWKKG